VSLRPRTKEARLQTMHIELGEGKLVLVALLLTPFQCTCLITGFATVENLRQNSSNLCYNRYLNNGVRAS
jgi:hypothetical protein